MTIKKWMTVCCLTAAIPMSIIAQEKQFTLQDLIPGGKNYRQFQPKNLNQLQWCGDQYLYAKGDSLMKGEKAQPVTVALTRQQLNQSLTAAGLKEVGRMPFLGSV